MKIVKAHEVKRLIMSYAFFERGHIAAVTEGINEADVLSVTAQKKAVEFEIKVSRSDLNKELAAIRYAIMTMKEGKSLGPIDKGPEQEQLNLELAGLKQKAGGWSKISKHEEYIDPKKYLEEHKSYILSGYRYLPNYFYIVVPRTLSAYATEKLDGTSYGVIAFDGCRQEGQHYAYFKDGVWYDRHEDLPDGTEWVRGAPCNFSARGCRVEVAVKKKARKIHPEPISDRILLAILNRACAENIRMLDELVRVKEAAA